MAQDRVDENKREATRVEIRDQLVKVAKRGALIPYSALCEKLTTTKYVPNSKWLAEDLSEISTAEHAEGRGLLSVIVVRKDTRLPGDGFFGLAATRGYDVADPERSFQLALDEVFFAWQKSQ